MKRLLGRLAGFSVLPVLSALIPLLALPLVAPVGGADFVSGLGVGQSVGALAATVAFVGWNVMGTPRVAQASPRGRLELYGRAFYTRGLAVLILLAPVSVVTLAISGPSARTYSLLFALGSALTALGISWYAVGVSSPATIAVFELGPKILATLAVIPIVLLTRDAWWYPVGLILAPVLGTLSFHLATFSRVVPPWPGREAIAAELRTHRSGWAVEITGNLYANAPVPVAAATSSVNESAAYTSSDKVYRWGLLSVIAVGNALQGWVLEARGDARRRRNVLAIVIMSVQGVLGGLFLVFFGVPVGELIFSEAVGADRAAMMWLGLAFFAVCSSTPLIRNILMPAMRGRAVLRVTIVSAVLGIITMIVAALQVGPSGVALGLAMSEALTLVSCCVLVVRIGLGDENNRVEA